jgi:hypothetical protein
MDRIEIYLQKSAMSQFEQGDKVAEGGGSIKNSLGKMFAAGTAAVGAKWGLGKISSGFSKGVSNVIDQGTKHIAEGGLNKVIEGHPVIDQFKSAWNKFTGAPAADQFAKKSQRVSSRAENYVQRSTNKVAPTPAPPVVKQDVGAVAQPGGRSSYAKPLDAKFKRVKQQPIIKT